MQPMAQALGPERKKWQPQRGERTLQTPRYIKRQNAQWFTCNRNAIGLMPN